jgi:hypothetical protein
MQTFLPSVVVAAKQSFQIWFIAANDGGLVQIVQDPTIGRQWFYTVSCREDYENRPCRLISEE